MHQTRFLQLVISGTGLVLASAAVTQRDFADVEIKTHKVADGVYYLEGAGGNIGQSAGEDGVVMIDDQFAPLTDRIVAAIRVLDAGEIRFVINTHLHGDHTGGNENLGRMGLILARDDTDGDTDPAARYRGTHGDPERFLQAVYAELGGASHERR